MHYNYDSNGKLTSIKTKTQKRVNGELKDVEEVTKIKPKKEAPTPATKPVSGSNSGNASTPTAPAKPTGASQLGNAPAPVSKPRPTQPKPTTQTPKPEAKPAVQPKPNGISSELEQQLAVLNSEKEAFIKETGGYIDVNFFIQGGKIKCSCGASEKLIKERVNTILEGFDEELVKEYGDIGKENIEKVKKMFKEELEMIFRKQRVEGNLEEIDSIARGIGDFPEESLNALEAKIEAYIKSLKK
jgi:hypothetical protein